MTEGRSKASRIKPVAKKSSPTATNHSLQTDQRLALILNAVDEGYWDWNVSTGEIVYGQGWLARLGYSQHDLSRDRTFWESIIHPDELAAFELKLKAHLDGDSPDFNCECRLRTRSGHYLWFRNHGKVVDRAKDGRPVRMVGTIVNVDERRQAQKELATSQAQLTTLFESTDDIIWSVDPEDFRLIIY